MLLDVVQFSFFCFTLPFYMFIISFIIYAQSGRIKDLSTPFFKLCITTGFIDIIAYINNYFGAIFPKWGWFSKFYLHFDFYYAHLYFYLAWYSNVSQAMSVAVVATNRLTALLFPNSTWKNEHIRAAYIVQFVPGMLLATFTFFNPTELCRNSVNGVVPNMINQDLTDFFYQLCGGLLIIISVYLIGSYCYLIIMLRKNSEIMQTRMVNISKAAIKARNREWKLFAMSIITVAIQILALVLLLVYSYKIIVMDLEEFYSYYNVVSDIYSGINPYLLWIFSDNLRSHILRTLGFPDKSRVFRKTTVINNNSVNTTISKHVT